MSDPTDKPEPTERPGEDGAEGAAAVDDARGADAPSADVRPEDVPAIRVRPTGDAIDRTAPVSGLALPGLGAAAGEASADGPSLSGSSLSGTTLSGPKLGGPTVGVTADASRAGKSSPQVTMRLDAVKAAPASGGRTMPIAAHTDTSSPDAVRETSSPTAVHPAVRRRSTGRRARALPLAALLATFAIAVAVGSAVLRARPPEPPPAAPIAASSEGLERVSLPAIETVLGLTEDNKELVLALCYQLSDNYATECRRQYLTELGEYPHRTASFDAIEVDRYEVSNDAWAACEAAGACGARDFDACAFYSVARGRELRTPVPDSMRAGDRPAVCVDYTAAEAFCAWRGMRLPTADEWERVARSGDDRLQPWGQFVMPGLMNWGERILKHFPIPGRVDGHELTAPVDAYRSGATDDGVHNLLGNVAEWVAPAATPDSSGTPRAGVRGGSYVDGAQNLRLTYHRELPIDATRSTVGFRCVR